jgi:hypothetical protein
MLRIRDVYPGSRVRKIPGDRIRIRIKELKYFSPKKVLGNMIRDVHPGSGSRILIFYPSWIPDPGVKKAPNPNPQRR